jgi:hypothetical protein
LLPFLTNICLKVVSALLSGKVQNLTVEALLKRYQPPGSAALLTPNQWAVLQDAMAQSTSDIATATTLAGSVTATLIIALKGVPGWFWWVFMASIAIGFIIWIWVYTRKSLSDTGWLSLPIGWWVLGVTCSFDAALALLSFVVTHSSHSQSSASS